MQQASIVPKESNASLLIRRYCCCYLARELARLSAVQSCMASFPASWMKKKGESTTTVYFTQATALVINRPKRATKQPAKTTSVFTCGHNNLLYLQNRTSQTLDFRSDQVNTENNCTPGADRLLNKQPCRQPHTVHCSALLLYLCLPGCYALNT